MLPDIENLLKLQDTDKEIRRLQDEIAEFPKRVAVIEQKLAGTKAQLEKAQAAVKADEASRRKYDTAINDLRGKISKYRDQSLDVKTNEQYKALLHEIQFAEKEIAANEDRILELMVNADARDKEVKAAQAELKAETAEIEKEKEEARQRTAEDEKLLAEWRAKRDQIRAGVNEDLLRHYERVSKFRGSGTLRSPRSPVHGLPRHAPAADLQRSPLRPADHRLRFLPAHSLLQSRRRTCRPEAVDHAPQAPSSRKSTLLKPGTTAQNSVEIGEVFLCLTTSRGQASRRVYDVHTGRLIGDILIREGDYRQAFPEDITGAMRLNGSWSEDELDAFGTELPMVALDSLRSDLDLARHEAATGSHAKPSVPVAPTEQAAS